MHDTFYSKRDLWLLLLLNTACLVEVGGGVFVMLMPNPVAWLSLMMFATAGFVGWLLVSTRYIVDDAQVSIRSGPFRWTVAIDEIQDITPTRNPLSSPALSLDRLRINYLRHGKQRAIMISPEDKQGFLDAVARHSSWLSKR